MRTPNLSTDVIDVLADEIAHLAEIMADTDPDSAEAFVLGELLDAIAEWREHHSVLLATVTRMERATDDLAKTVAVGHRTVSSAQAVTLAAERIGEAAAAHDAAAKRTRRMVGRASRGDSDLARIAVAMIDRFTAAGLF